MSHITFQQESLTPSLINEIVPLSPNHFHEVAVFDDLSPKVRISDYEQAQENGHLRIYTARNGHLAGYAFFIVSKQTHAADSLQATQSLLYLSPEYRQGWNGIQFVKACDDKLKEEGVEVVYLSSSVKKDIGPVLAHIGYIPIETTYARRFK